MEFPWGRDKKERKGRENRKGALMHGKEKVTHYGEFGKVCFVEIWLKFSLKQEDPCIFS